MKTTLGHLRTFFSSFLRSPNTVGSIAPSSRFLARSLARSLPPGVLTVVELGPGTGSVTAELHRTLPAGSRLIVVELSPDFSARLEGRFPGVEIITGDARHLPTILKEHGLTQVDAVISCLPLGNLSRTDAHAILVAARAVLRPGGRFAMFQYLGWNFREVRQLFSSIHIRWVPLNIPPAFVFRGVRPG